MRRGKHDFPTPITEDDDINEAFRKLDELGVTTSVPATPENLRKLFDRSEWFKDETEEGISDEDHSRNT